MILIFLPLRVSCVLKGSTPLRLSHHPLTATGLSEASLFFSFSKSSHQQAYPASVKVCDRLGNPERTRPHPHSRRRIPRASRPSRYWLLSRIQSPTPRPDALFPLGRFGQPQLPNRLGEGARKRERILFKCPLYLKWKDAIFLTSNPGYYLLPFLLYHVDQAPRKFLNDPI